MGKRIEKFVKDISARADQCSEQCEVLNKLSELMEQNGDKWTDKVMAEMRQIGDWEKHPVAIERAKIWDRGMKLKNDLKNDVNAMDKVLGEFKTMISKREKYKNPFKSKKALPAAKAIIADFEGVKKDLSAVYTAMGSVFR